MQSLRQMALLPLFLAAGCFVYYYLVPSGGLSKSVRCVLSVIFLTSVCLLFCKISDNIGLPDYSPEQYQTEIEQPYVFYENAAKKLAEKTAADIVKRYTNVPVEIQVSVSSEENDIIRILSVELLFDALPEGKEKMTEELTKEFGFVPVIRVKNQNE